MSSWPSRMWPMDKHYSHIGSSGGYGVGYCRPRAAPPTATSRFSINFQPDGDMMYVPGVLWTAARHKIPMLTVMHNNRGYHQELMHVQRMSNRRDRVAYLGNDLGPMGTSIQNPDIDYAKLAQSMGWWAAGPVTDPNQLGETFKKAVDVVKSGQPALVDVVTQPR